jgi:hypothetical protein
MISEQMVYELVDLRSPERDSPILAPAVMLKSVKNALHIHAANGRGYVFELPPEDDTKLIEQHEDLNQVVFHTPDGRMVLTPLTLDSYNRSVRPFLSGPALKSTDEVQNYWSTVIRLA